MNRMANSKRVLMSAFARKNGERNRVPRIFQVHRPPLATNLALCLSCGGLFFGLYQLERYGKRRGSELGRIVQTEAFKHSSSDDLKCSIRKSWLLSVSPSFCSSFLAVPSMSAALSVLCCHRDVSVRQDTLAMIRNLVNSSCFSSTPISPEIVSAVLSCCARHPRLALSALLDIVCSPSVSTESAKAARTLLVQRGAALKDIHDLVTVSDPGEGRVLQKLLTALTIDVGNAHRMRQSPISFVLRTMHDRTPSFYSTLGMEILNQNKKPEAALKDFVFRDAIERFFSSYGIYLVSAMVWPTIRYASRLPLLDLFMIRSIPKRTLSSFAGALTISCTDFMIRQAHGFEHVPLEYQFATSVTAVPALSILGGLMGSSFLVIPSVLNICKLFLVDHVSTRIDTSETASYIKSAFSHAQTFFRNPKTDR
ncbi:putative mitochondrial protein [Andalucia godoyi]|uniref:Putative mitochondrial protein n=1 Tax=Andalucia godoyi TaxID=505711 RepID=A0A8K0AH94_ANDGO|nr:putative mitochondrial protein [Andalucia godoyi]|eukprot:ANDGO_07347.mRNA.1 putative mitochondrial protein